MKLPYHRVITIQSHKAQSSLVVQHFLQWCGQLPVHIIGKRDNFLIVQTELAGFKPLTIQHGPVILEKKKTAQTTQPQAILNNKGPTEYYSCKHLGVTQKNHRRFEPATFTSAVCYANNSATENCYRQCEIKNISRIASDSNQKFYKCSFWAAYTIC